MTLEERSEVLPILYRQRAELYTVLERCRLGGHLNLAMLVQSNQEALNNVIEYFEPDPPAQEQRSPAFARV